MRKSFKEITEALVQLEEDTSQVVGQLGAGYRMMGGEKIMHVASKAILSVRRIGPGQFKIDHYDDKKMISVSTRARNPAEAASLIRGHMAAIGNRNAAH